MKADLSLFPEVLFCYMDFSAPLLAVYYLRLVYLANNLILVLS